MSINGRAAGPVARVSRLKNKPQSSGGLKHKGGKSPVDPTCNSGCLKKPKSVYSKPVLPPKVSTEDKPKITEGATVCCSCFFNQCDEGCPCAGVKACVSCEPHGFVCKNALGSSPSLANKRQLLLAVAMLPITNVPTPTQSLFTGTPALNPQPAQSPQTAQLTLPDNTTTIVGQVKQEVSHLSEQLLQHLEAKKKETIEAVQTRLDIFAKEQGKSEQRMDMDRIKPTVQDVRPSLNLMEPMYWPVCQGNLTKEYQDYPVPCGGATKVQSYHLRRC